MDRWQSPNKQKDPFTEAMFNAAGEAVRDWLIKQGNTSRPISNLLNSDSLMGIAWAAVSAYLDKRAELERQQAAKPLPDAPLGI